MTIQDFILKKVKVCHEVILNMEMNLILQPFKRTTCVIKNEFSANLTKQSCATYKTGVLYMEKTLSMHLLNLNDYGTKNLKSYRYISRFSQFVLKLCVYWPIEKMFNQRKTFLLEHFQIFEN